MRASLWVGGVGIALVVAGCNGDTVYTPPHSHPPSTGEALPADPLPMEDQLLVRAAICEYRARCTPAALGMYQGGDLQGCLDAPFCNTVSFDSRAHLVDFDACLESLRNGPCTANVFPGMGVTSYQSPSPCAQAAKDYSAFYVGKPGLGEACLSGGDEFPCSEGWCRVEEPLRQSGSQFCGTCVAALAPGEPCTDDDRCGQGTRCLEGQCRTPLENGEPCVSDEQCYRYACHNGFCAYQQDAEPPPPNYGEHLGELCESKWDCGPDPTVNCVAGVCVSAPDRGEPCDDLEDCRIGLGCHEGVCEEVACYVELGGFCGRFATCAGNSFCDETGHCTALPGEGEPCSDWLIACPSGLNCDPDTNLCLAPPPPLPVGAPCVDGWFGFGSGPAQCEEGSICLRDLTPYCDHDTGCSIPDCETECGVCTVPPGAAGCQ